MRRGEAVAGGLDGRAVEPRNLDIDSRRPELNRWGRVVVESVRVLAVVGRDREHRRVLGRVAGRLNVVDRADEHHVVEIGLVRYLMEQPEVVLLYTSPSPRDGLLS